MVLLFNPSCGCHTWGTDVVFWHRLISVKMVSCPFCLACVAGARHRRHFLHRRCRRQQLCCTPNNFLYLRARITKFLPVVHFLKTQVKFEYGSWSTKFKGQKVNELNIQSCTYAVHTITLHSFEVESWNSYQWYISWRLRSSLNMGDIRQRWKVKSCCCCFPVFTALSKSLWTFY